MRLADARPNHPMLVWVPAEGEEASWTYSQFVHQVRCVAGGLSARGISVGDRILVHLENAPEALIARFACAWLGAICVATNAMATGPELAVLADAVGVRAAITQPSLAEMVASHVRGLDWIATTDSGAGHTARPNELPQRSDRFASLCGEPMPMRAPDLTLPALILFTTGTTARAKAVLWTHENMLWAARLGAAQQGFLASDVTQLFLPLFHVVGFSWAFLPAIWSGGTVVLQPRFSATRFWPTAVAHRSTVSPHVPFTMAALMQQERPPAHHFRQWITNRQMPREQAHFGIEQFSSAWGMTEMISQPIIGDPRLGPLAANAVGRPSVGYEVRIVDERGRGALAGENGELLVRGIRGRSIFLEYFGDADATRNAFEEDGFFRSGDRVRLNEDGTITFVDRIKDVIKVGGEGVAASEIEAVIQAVPGVAEVAVVAGPDPLRSEVPVAFVVRHSKDGSEGQLRAEIEEACKLTLARFKVPRRIIFIDQLPRVGFGKVSKAKLRVLATEALDKPVSAS
ncbi:class I adenylate-forming enzyme family protein [Chelativorans sp.]|uniref:class I adenylate-forming enzyme family protein n=1 Tax=Chelativorans sp. TaxID=2203393 RepID=UPI002810A054|nr:class I adenylate-forming enzyme family protein [Chelativorans sp.]